MIETSDSARVIPTSKSELPPPIQKLKDNAEAVINTEQAKAAQTFSPLDLGKIRQAIEKYRRARGIK